MTWPVPALLTWGAAWALSVMLKAAGAPLWAVLALPAAAAACAALLPFVAATPWRRVFVAAGFPLSVVALGQGAGLPGWLWLLPLAVLLLAYPLNAWRDAPLFPTPAEALALLPQHAPLPVGAQVLDAGCGLGHGLRALHRVYPEAALHGVEWSWPLRLLCALRCPWARVRRGDMWAEAWGGFELVYLFQRPESMPQAIDKARRELKAGAWLVSLEFEAPGLAPHARIDLTPTRSVWVYQLH